MTPYLLVLEIEPLETGELYDELPLHCTLVHWFLIEIENEKKLISSLGEILKNKEAPNLLIENEEEFTGFTKSGTIPVLVNTVHKSPYIRSLHEEVCEVLESIGVEYIKPQYIRDGYVPHITHQKGKSVIKGDGLISSALYIIGADAPEYGNKRRVIRKFTFKP